MVTFSNTLSTVLINRKYLNNHGWLIHIAKKSLSGRDILRDNPHVRSDFDDLCPTGRR